jgi:hypothetical protein
MNSVQAVKDWFDKLPSDQQQEVLEFLYDKKNVVKVAGYVGPRPGLFQRGLSCGPVPSSDAGRCAYCGRPY